MCHLGAARETLCCAAEYLKFAVNTDCELVPKTNHYDFDQVHSFEKQLTSSSSTNDAPLSVSSAISPMASTQRSFTPKPSRMLHRQRPI